MWKWGAVVYDRPLCRKKISWSQTWPLHQRSPKSHQWFHQISTNSIALTCTHSSSNVQVTLISLCESVTLSPRPPVRRKKDRLRSWIRFLLLAQISFSEICLLSDYRNNTTSLVLQEGVLGTRGLHNGIYQHPNSAVDVLWRIYSVDLCGCCPMLVGKDNKEMKE